MTFLELLNDDYPEDVWVEKELPGGPERDGGARSTPRDRHAGRLYDGRQASDARHSRAGQAGVRDPRTRLWV
jgi:hypothetical protein